MVITNLEEKENRKIWVPIRPGNRGGWSLFDWQKVRQMPYRDREMYLGNSAKIGVLDKGGKWRKKDWYLKKNELTASQLAQMQSEAMRKDRERMNLALGYVEKDEDQKLTPAEMQLLLKKIKGQGVEQPIKIQGDAIGLGFDKTRVQIRAKPTVKIEDNPHRLQGVYLEKQEKISPKQPKQEKNQKKHKKQKKQKKEKKQKKKNREKSQPKDQSPHKRNKQDQDSYEMEKKRRRRRSRSDSEDKAFKERSRSRSYQKERHRRYRSRSRSQERHRKREFEKKQRHERSDRKYHHEKESSRRRQDSESR